MRLSLVNSSLHVLYVYVNCTLMHYILQFIMFVDYEWIVQNLEPTWRLLYWSIFFSCSSGYCKKSVVHETYWNFSILHYDGHLGLTVKNNIPLNLIYLEIIVFIEFFLFKNINNPFSFNVNNLKKFWLFFFNNDIFHNKQLRGHNFYTN